MADPVRAREDADLDTSNRHAGTAQSRLAESALAQGTRDTYVRAVRQFDDWRGGRTPTDPLLADYMGVLFERGLAPATAETAVAAIADRARRDGVPSPVGKLARLTLSGFRREGAERGSGQVAGISWEQADRMAETAENTNRTGGLRDAFLTRLMSDCLLRVSEASALDVADISFVDDSLQVVVRRSKTDQEGDGAVLYAGPPTARLAHLWLATTGIDEGALFRRVNKAGAVDDGRLSARRMRDIVKRLAEDVGIEGRVSGHSFRVGAAQSLRAAGTDTPELMAAGRWNRIETMVRYIRTQNASTGPVARLRYGVEGPDGRRPAHAGSMSPGRSERSDLQMAKTVALARKELSRAKKEAKKLRKTVAWLRKAMVGSQKADLRNQSQTIVPVRPFPVADVPIARSHVDGRAIPAEPMHVSTRPATVRRRAARVDFLNAA